MVHALLESWRTLKDDGYLIDLRPLVSRPPIQIITSSQTFQPGHINDDAGKPDDVAADSAVLQTVQSGYFSRQTHHTFQFNLYFYTLDDMLNYVNEKWAKFAHIPPSVVENVRQTVTTIKAPYQVRIREQMHLALYKKRRVA